MGGGIVGCAAAAFLAEAGARVELFESGELAGAASGRNSGAIQHPFDPVLSELHRETIGHYRELDGFALPDEPAGLLMVAASRAAIDPVAAEIGADLGVELLDPDALRALEPGLTRGLWGCRVDTGYPVRPAAATLAFARRAARAGALLHEGRTAWPWVMGGGVRGVLAGGEHCAAGAVLVAAGPWTPEVIDPTLAWQPIVPVWGVVIEVSMADPPRHVLEQADVSELGLGAAPESLFSLVTADGVAALGSTFLAQEPDPAAWAGRLKREGVSFVPALERAKVEGARACARPQSLDGRPLVGPLAGTEGLWVAAGHGPWGISTGPATARLAADALLGGAEAPSALAPGRFAHVG
ncbi:MAG: D-hydroxyproline dehydrogenase subunit beta [Thermoleophilaceae bacterium]|nr:D-hydroxyproline dehydrogenase subunit beta [Thermoleophilaceae bacterium]